MKILDSTVVSIIKQNCCRRSTKDTSTKALKSIKEILTMLNHLSLKVTFFLIGSRYPSRDENSSNKYEQRMAAIYNIVAEARLRPDRTKTETISRRNKQAQVHVVNCEMTWGIYFQKR